ncbi:uncharacterized protein LOC111805597 isoform X2 [Cucurbita pepo subsp. pepo]|uniref:uncharacterized protein LOC111805597 isoform X2 n=1 Tax=Cucurbita pepo subsp. pepo TaxID=3664 RepID=UPI000C9D7CFB|nr:uncharacterized protein LOC111805597 isoform X2 [Cucurbita pepo subsp. pepo]
MNLLTINCRCKSTNAASTFNPLTWRNSTFIGRKVTGLIDVQRVLPTGLWSSKVYAKRKPARKLERTGEEVSIPSSSVDDNAQDVKMNSSDSSPKNRLINISSRSSVLQACIITSGLIAALGVIIRQVSHVASIEGLPVIDCTSEVSFSFEMRQLQLITGLVVLISSSRFLLLKLWPDFAESSEAANRQVLTSLQPIDYALVAFLPGISEELLFRGALIPLLGFNWASVMLTAAIFGILHLGGGRKYSFAIWASFVGLAYGYATIESSSVVVPMASHALNNLVGGILWRYQSMNLENGEDQK